MASPLLALFVRSLRVDSRAISTLAARFGLVGVTFLFFLGLNSMNGRVAAPGLSYFRTIVTIDVIAILLATVSYFVSAITEEKEENTLGLLRMTNLSPLSILLGKSTSRLFGALLLLLAQFPFTLLAVSLGGIAMNQIAAAFCTLGAFLIFSANLALLASVVFKRTNGAAIFTGAGLFLFFVFVPVANFLTSLPVTYGLMQPDSLWVTAIGRAAVFVDAASPFSRLTEIFATGFQGGPGSLQVWSNLGAGAACFLISWLVFEQFCGEQKESAQARGIMPTRRSLFRWFGAGRAWPLALAWKDFHFMLGGWPSVLARFVAYGAVNLVLYAAVHWFSSPETENTGHFSSTQIGFLLFYVSLVWILVEIAFAAGSLFRNERQWQTLSSLAMLPQSMRMVAYQKVLGIIPSLIPASLYLVAGVLIYPDLLASSSGRTTLAFISFRVFSQCVFFFHLAASLSLRIKRGALPISFGIFLLGNMFISLFLHRFLSNDLKAFFEPLLFLAMAGVLHEDIIRRLKVVAGE